MTHYVAPDFEIRDGEAMAYVRVAGQRVARVVSDTSADLLPDVAPGELRSGKVHSMADGAITAGDAWLLHASREELLALIPAAADQADQIGAVLSASARCQARIAEGASKVTYLHGDHLGSLLAATDDTGTVVHRAVRDPFGLPKTDAVSDFDYTFTGKELDASTGFYNFGGRYYLPREGRWASPDPLLLEHASSPLTMTGDLNPYAFAGNNPLRFVDDSGFRVAIPISERPSQQGVDVKAKSAYTVYTFAVYDFDSHALYKAAVARGEHPVAVAQFDLTASVQQAKRPAILGPSQREVSISVLQKSAGAERPSKYALKLHDVGTSPGSGKLHYADPSKEVCRSGTCSSDLIRVHTGGPNVSRGCMTSSDPSYVSGKITSKGETEKFKASEGLMRFEADISAAMGLSTEHPTASIVLPGTGER